MTHTNFVGIDPITSIHMGITKNGQILARARKRIADLSKMQDEADEIRPSLTRPASTYASDGHLILASPATIGNGSRKSSEVELGNVINNSINSINSNNNTALVNPSPTQFMRKRAGSANSAAGNQIVPITSRQEGNELLQVQQFRLPSQQQQQQQMAKPVSNANEDISSTTSSIDTVDVASLEVIFLGTDRLLSSIDQEQSTCIYKKLTEKHGFKTLTQLIDYLNLMTFSPLAPSVGQSNVYANDLAARCFRHASWVRELRSLNIGAFYSSELAQVLLTTSTTSSTSYLQRYSATAETT